MAEKKKYYSRFIHAHIDNAWGWRSDFKDYSLINNRGPGTNQSITQNYLKAYDTRLKNSINPNMYSNLINQLSNCTVNSSLIDFNSSDNQKLITYIMRDINSLQQEKTRRAKAIDALDDLKSLVGNLRNYFDNINAMLKNGLGILDWESQIPQQVDLNLVNRWLNVSKTLESMEKFLKENKINKNLLLKNLKLTGTDGNPHPYDHVFAFFMIALGITTGFMAEQVGQIEFQKLIKDNNIEGIEFITNGTKSGIITKKIHLDKRSSYWKEQSENILNIGNQGFSTATTDIKMRYNGFQMSVNLPGISVKTSRGKSVKFKTGATMRGMLSSAESGGLINQEIRQRFYQIYSSYKLRWRMVKKDTDPVSYARVTMKKSINEKLIPTNEWKTYLDNVGEILSIPTIMGSMNEEDLAGYTLYNGVLLKNTDILFQANNHGNFQGKTGSNLLSRKISNSLRLGKHQANIRQKFSDKMFYKNFPTEEERKERTKQLIDLIEAIQLNIDLDRTFLETLKDIKINPGISINKFI